MRKALLTLLLVFVAPVTVAATLQGTFDRVFDVPPGSLFALENLNGRIAVQSWDEPRVRVHAVKKVDGSDADEVRAMFDGIAVVPSATANGLRVETRVPPHATSIWKLFQGGGVSFNVDYEINVPRSMDLNLQNTNGSIDIAGVRGSIRVSDTNGSIDCSRCAGDVDAETTNGKIRAELSEVRNGKAIRLESTNGALTIVLPKSIGAQLDAATTNGSIDSDLPVLTRERHGNALRGTINGGGAELHLRTTNGSISIEAQ